MSIEHSPGRRLLSPKQVMGRMDWSRTTLWRRVVAGEFPAPVKTGPNSTAFYEDEVDAAQANLPRVNYAPAPEAA
jgi:prophage regulatory protein